MGKPRECGFSTKIEQVAAVHVKKFACPIRRSIA
jgi:hypothetical protein